MTTKLQVYNLPFPRGPRLLPTFHLSLLTPCIEQHNMGPRMSLDRRRMPSRPSQTVGKSLSVRSRYMLALHTAYIHAMRCSESKSRPVPLPAFGVRGTRYMRRDPRQRDGGAVQLRHGAGTSIVSCMCLARAIGIGMLRMHRAAAGESCLE